MFDVGFGVDRHLIPARLDGGLQGGKFFCLTAKLCLTRTKVDLALLELGAARLEGGLVAGKRGGGLSSKAEFRGLAVLRLLLEERVSIRNLFLIIETVGEAKARTSNPSQLAELVRQRLGFQIVDRLQDGEGRLPLLQLGPNWEEQFSAHEITKEDGASDIALPPDVFGDLTTSIQKKLNEYAQKGVTPSIATTSRRRRFIHTVLSSKGIRNSVLAYEEIGSRSKPYIVGVV